MAKPMTPMTLWSNWVQAGMITAEAQAVIAMRMWGLAGLWSVPNTESTRMVAEKAGAFTGAWLAASEAAVRGADPMSAAMKPIRKKTKSNVRRLSRRGPNLR